MWKKSNKHSLEKLDEM